jgi:hypothetical protein
MAVDSQSLPRGLTSRFWHGCSDAQASPNRSQRQAGGIAVEIARRPYGDSFWLPAWGGRVGVLPRTQLPSGSAAVGFGGGGWAGQGAVTAPGRLWRWGTGSAADSNGDSNSSSHRLPAAASGQRQRITLARSAPTEEYVRPEKRRSVSPDAMESRKPLAGTRRWRGCRRPRSRSIRPARTWSAGGIIRSSVVTRYQLGAVAPRLPRGRGDWPAWSAAWPAARHGSQSSAPNRPGRRTTSCAVGPSVVLLRWSRTGRAGAW